ncbi:hypothetical protein FHW36_106290 [Chitinophaga polysaccharea]|uniref:Immunity protein 40 of polymorphic toxin system n=1 Tax=Chitinophaga polysaccharea TaxID=1293035 RepID=A0A561PLT7_9BACT|nr:hypothetical protein [Chitinophaga polysaccharea]TWF39066.1 hypothetical protein FHW36_106290 [Chitinophaga polysaccharea]
MNKVEQIFVEEALERGGLLLYTREIALKFVKECRNENIHLLGIDGFFLIDNSTQPSMADSIDFSSLFFEGDVYKKAIDFLEKRPIGMFFEIICE